MSSWPSVDPGTHSVSRWDVHPRFARVCVASGVVLAQPPPLFWLSMHPAAVCLCERGGNSFTSRTQVCACVCWVCRGRGRRRRWEEEVGGGGGRMNRMHCFTLTWHAPPQHQQSRGLRCGGAYTCRRTAGKAFFPFLHLHTLSLTGLWHGVIPCRTQKSACTQTHMHAHPPKASTLSQGARAHVHGRQGASSLTRVQTAHPLKKG